MTVTWTYARLTPSRDLCGTTPEEFARLVEGLAPFVEARRYQLADRPGRLRAAGAGRRPKPFWVRLFATLTMWRQGSTVRVAGKMFGVHERTIRRWRDEIEEVLVAHGFFPPGATEPIRSVEDLGAYLDAVGAEAVMVDGTEIARDQPMGYQDRKAAWSGKTKDHVVKATVVADRGRRPIWFEANPSGEGRTHDITMLRAQTGLLSVLTAVAAGGRWVMGDKGYTGLHHDLGVNAVCSIPKPPGKDRSFEARLYNRVLSSMRMPVEHAIGRLKWWRVMHHWRRAVDRFDRGGRAIAVLASMI